jgi:hypothetical protein
MRHQPEVVRNGIAVIHCDSISTVPTADLRETLSRAIERFAPGDFLPSRPITYEWCPQPIGIVVQID